MGEPVTAILLSLREYWWILLIVALIVALVLAAWHWSKALKEMSAKLSSQGPVLRISFRGFGVWLDMLVCGVLGKLERAKRKETELADILHVLSGVAVAPRAAQEYKEAKTHEEKQGHLHRWGTAWRKGGIHEAMSTSKFELVIKEAIQEKSSPVPVLGDPSHGTIPREAP
jgi:uncharacterized membrane protein YidH (DUF202 family)